MADSWGPLVQPISTQPEIPCLYSREYFPHPVLIRGVQEPWALGTRPDSDTQPGTFM